MITKEQLEKYKSLKINEVKTEDLVELNDIKVDTSLPVPLRILNFIEDVKNPYIYKVNGTIVKVSYSENAPSLNERILNILNKKST